MIMNDKPAILFYCQHSLGMGHLMRSLAIADALVERFRVVLLNGGRLPKGIRVHPDIELVNLPPIGIDEANQLVSHDKRISIERALDRRRRMILTCFEELRPVAIIVELFPFGRKKFAGELLPLLQAARAPEKRALIVCSLRDILVNRRSDQQKYDDRAAAVTNEFFDAVLVHSDPAFARFEETFHPQIPLEVPVKYTGFVVPQATSVSITKTRRKRVVVSAGGGVVGEPLLRLSIEAHRHFANDPEVEMKVIAGPLIQQSSWQALRTQARGKKQLQLVRHVTDLCGELTNASVSISQAGYNTCLDVLRAGVPALLVPFTKEEEDEQRRRALRLQHLGLVKVLAQEEQTPERLAAEIRGRMDFKFPKTTLDLGGAQCTVKLIESML